MKHQFTLRNVPKSTIEMEFSKWAGKQTLYKDDVPPC